MLGSTITFRCDVGLQIVGHRPHLFGHSNDGQEPGELGDKAEVFRAEQKCFQPFSIVGQVALTPVCLGIRPRRLDETARRIL